MGVAISNAVDWILTHLVSAEKTLFARQDSSGTLKAAWDRGSDLQSFRHLVHSLVIVHDDLQNPSLVLSLLPPDSFYNRLLFLHTKSTFFAYLLAPVVIEYSDRLSLITISVAVRRKGAIEDGGPK